MDGDEQNHKLRNEEIFHKLGEAKALPKQLSTPVIFPERS